MSGPPTDKQADDQRLALAALSLSRRLGGPATQTAVSDEDLAQLANRQLPFARRQDILSRLLDDPGGLQRWLNLMEATEGLAAPAVSAPKRRLRAFGGWRPLAGALALGGAYAMGMMTPAFLASLAAPSTPPPVRTVASPPPASTAAPATPVATDEPPCVEVLHPLLDTPGWMCPVSLSDPAAPQVWIWHDAEHDAPLP